MWRQTIKIHNARSDKVQKRQDQLAIEALLDVEINGQHYTTLSCFPQQEIHIVTGHLYSKGLINSLNDIDQIEKKEATLSVTLNSPWPATPADLDLNNRPHLAETHETHLIRRKQVFHLTAFFQEKALLFKDMAITESAAIASAKDLLVMTEELHRLQAVEKAVGMALSQDISIDEHTLLLTSGKIDYEMMMRCVRVGIGGIISRTAPSNKAYELAQEAGVACLGFARGTKFNVYTCASRIDLND